MDQKVNKSGELSIEDQFNLIVNWERINLVRKLSWMTIENQIDFLQYLRGDKNCNDKGTAFIRYEIQTIIFRNLLEEWILGTCLKHKYPKYNNHTQMLHFSSLSVIFLEKGAKKEFTHSFDEISVWELRVTHNQLKLWWWVTEEVASSVSEFNKAQLSLLEMKKQFESIGESTLKNPLVMQEIIKTEKFIKKLLSWLSEKKDLFNSDLWPLAEKMWWHLHYSWRTPFTIGTIQIRDKENKLVEIWWKNSRFQTFKCVFSSDIETIALSELGWVTLKFVDKEKKDQEITWQQYSHDYVKRKEEYYDFIDSEMYDLANIILKKWFSWKIRDFQNKYFVLLTGSWCVFFDEEWNELSDEEWKKEFDKIEIVDWNVKVKGLKKVDGTEKKWITQIRHHRKKPWND